MAGLNGQHLTEAAREGDEVALAAFDEIARWLGAGIASLCVLLDPERIIIGGGVIEAGDILLTPLRKAVESEMPFFGAHPMAEIVAAQLGNSAGLIGVADLARH